MCESVEVVRILNFSDALLNSTCRQNSAIASMSILAKLRLPEKSELTLLSFQLENSIEKLSLCSSSSTMKKSSSLESLSSCSYSSSPENSDIGKERLFAGIENLIDGVHKIDLFTSAKVVDQTSSHSRNIIVSDDENSKKLSDDDDEEDDEEDEEEEEEENDEGLIERGPIRPQLHLMHNRSSPYVDTLHTRQSYGNTLPNENSTDYDTSAKEILTDHEYRQKIDFCLDKLSDMSQEKSPMPNSLSPTDSDFGSASSAFSPSQQLVQQHWQADRSPTESVSSSSCFVPSITVSDSESSLLEILSRGGFQSAQSARTPEHTSLACNVSDAPDSPSSSYNACANSSVSRPESRASSQSPGVQSSESINGSVTGSNTGPSFLNILGSPSQPLGSPQITSSPNFHNNPRSSSSSSSGQSYCETPSPANYNNSLDPRMEDQLDEQMMKRLPIWQESFESSETLVNNVDSSELQLQLVEEIIRGDMRGVGKHQQDLQAVSYNVTPSPPYYTSNSKIGTGYVDNSEEHADDLTNTLLRFVGGESVAMDAQRRIEPSPNSTSGYSSSSSTSSEIRRNCDGSCMLQVNQTRHNNFLGNSRGSVRQPQHHTMSPQSVNASTPISMENLQFSTAPVELTGRNSWQNFSESNAILQKLANHFNDFQVPKTVETYNFKQAISSNKRASKRIIAPWPSLNLPSTRASERLQEMTDPRDVENAMKNLLKKPLDQLAKGDRDGDTMLMILVGNPMELRKKLAYVAPLVERLGTIDGALSMLNNNGEDALYLAAMNCPDTAFIAGYLAAAFLQKNIDIGQRLYRSRGDTLVHVLAAKGDAHGEVLAELLSLKTPQQNAVFDLSKRNYDGMTALHVAAEAHESLGRNSKTISIGTVRLLLENGADPMVREIRCGDTALHIAVSLSCDPSLVKALLTGRGREAVNIGNYNGNTPLHLAASIAERTSLERQSEICWHLVHAGSRSNLTNRQGKTPLALVSPGRKDALRRIFHKKT